MTRGSYYSAWPALLLACTLPDLVWATPPGHDASPCAQEVKYGSPKSSAIVWENDALSVGRKTDEYYTQGMRLDYTFPVKDPQGDKAGGSAPNSRLSAVLDRWSQELCHYRAQWFDPAASEPVYRSKAIIFGQHLFTPGNIHIPGPLPDDRPYAAWLYIGTRFQTIVASPTAAAYHNFELQIGIVGPAAQGEWVQSHFHRLIGVGVPLGWRYQLPNEPGVFANYRVSYRQSPLWPDGIVSADLIPFGELAVGNIQTYGEAGFNFRIGRNLGEPLHPLTPTFAYRASLAAPNPSASDSVAQKPHDTLWIAGDDDGHACLPILGLRECSLNIGVSGRAVARNIFLDGTSFSDSASVHKTPGYYDLTAGVRFRWSGAMLDYQFVRRSKEFSPVPVTGGSRDGHHDYGSATLRCIDDFTPICPLIVTAILGAMAFR